MRISAILAPSPKRIVFVLQDSEHFSGRPPAECKNLLDAGAVRLKWPADATRDEPESFTWCILTKGNWNDEARVLGWRFLGRFTAAPAELKKRREADQGGGRRRRRDREELKGRMVVLGCWHRHGARTSDSEAVAWPGN